MASDEFVHKMQDRISEQTKRAEREQQAKINEVDAIKIQGPKVWSAVKRAIGNAVSQIDVRDVLTTSQGDHDTIAIVHRQKTAIVSFDGSNAKIHYTGAINGGFAPNVSGVELKYFPQDASGVMAKGIPPLSAEEMAHKIIDYLVGH